MPGQARQDNHFWVLGAKPLGERVESNEVRTREKLLPIHASKEVPGQARQDSRPERYGSSNSPRMTST